MSPKALRLLFLGTPEFAVPSLRALAESRHSVVGVVSQPDRPRGRGRQLEPTPIHAEAARLNIEIVQPEKVESALGWMREREADLGVVVAFGQFIPRSVRELPAHGMINAHGSLLPRHRGAAPIAYSILCGDAQAGVTIIQVAREMDAGRESVRRAVDVGSDETTGELTERLSALAADAFVEAVDGIADGTLVWREQDHTHTTQAPKLARDFGKLDWRMPRISVLRRARAASPWPGSEIKLRKSGRELRLLRLSAGESFEAETVTPGRVEASRERLRVAASDGWIDVTQLQVPGRRPVSAAEFLRGARLDADEEVEIV